MKNEHTEIPEEESKIILYTTDDGKAQVSLMSRDGRIWLNQKQMAELFAVSKPNISMLISKILAEKELDDSVVKCYLTTAADGKTYKVILKSCMVRELSAMKRPSRFHLNAMRNLMPCERRKTLDWRTKQIWKN